ncbi:hypothetical protein GJ496_000340 [Pomphorhynchus laevis]|nr:hypothetical protein GJ496_000340 [Pomphorhynchus laevis]
MCYISGDTKDRLKLAFDMYDIDKNGTLDGKELTAILKILYSTRGEKGDPKKKAAEIIKKADISGDKKIDVHEFIHFLLNDNEMRHMLDHQII